MIAFKPTAKESVLNVAIVIVMIAIILVVLRIGVAAGQ
jgi:hypothetical protein